MLPRPPKRDKDEERTASLPSQLGQIQTGIKNRVHTILAKNSVSHDFSDLFGKAGKVFLLSLPLPEVHRAAINGYLSVLERLEEETRSASKMVKASATEDKEARLLMSIPGAGYYSTLLIKAEIGDINRFPSAKQLCS